MAKRFRWIGGLLGGVTCAAVLTIAGSVAGHCDTLDGPVVGAARAAMESGNVDMVLRWVQPSDEEQIRAAFEQTMKVRVLSDEARALADQYFFETLVRVHRAGEGAPYTGLKAAGNVDPSIAAADKALAEGTADALADAVAEHVADGIKHRFAAAMEAKLHANDSVEAGRRYVAAYVEYVHYVEGVHAAAASGGHHASADGDAEAGSEGHSRGGEH